jgi:hypothetical protein
MAALNPLSSNTILVTMDVTSLDTNIPYSDGIEACKENAISKFDDSLNSYFSKSMY